MSSSLDSAKHAVKSFLSKDGKHDTTVHTNTSPAVTNETVDKHRHENIVKATDREVHQDHYHTTVQPVHDTQRLKEQHHFNTVPVEERKFEHGNDKEIQQRLRAEQDQFHDTTRQGETKHTASTGGNLASEHVHHHVHENIQPVINRQTIEPHVVHTTVPVHEVHHSAAQHHGTTNLPAVSLEEFKAQGGSLGGHKHKSEFFEGEPREHAGHVSHPQGSASGGFRETGHHDQHDSGLTGSRHANTAGAAGTAGTTGTTGTTGATGTGLTGAHHHDGSAASGLAGSQHAGSHHTGTTGDHHGSATGDHTTTTKKPSLLDRLNPLKDADHDGKKGLMD